jgi:DNA mismatch repair ATPase MutS
LPGSTSLLARRSTVLAGGQEQPAGPFVSDLNLDQIADAISAEREEAALLARLVLSPLHDPEEIRHRHEVFRDLEDPALFESLGRFSESTADVRAHFRQIEGMRVPQQRQAWLLDAARIYCEAVRALCDDLEGATLRSRALLAVRTFVSSYVVSDEFTVLDREVVQVREGIELVQYCVHIRGGRVTVTPFAGEPDYSAEVGTVFERFRQGAAKDYRIAYRIWPGLNRVGAQILGLVAKLFRDEFAALEGFCTRHVDFFDATVRQFERELQFFLAVRAYLAPLEAAGLPFCYPDVSAESKEIFARDTFDLALAARLVPEGGDVVRNDFHLEGRERVFVVSGPNQGGKTTFARTFGQLHHLGSVGCPVPGSAARLHLVDRIFTHFEREEDISRLSGKLEDDLVRIKEILESATGDSVVILNELFTSTTLADARFLGSKVMRKILLLDCLCVYVTFVDELASMGETVVSMMSTIVPTNPAERTFKLVRAPANGLAYALAIAQKYNVTYEHLRRRIE